MYETSNDHLKVYVYSMKQDDPFKCTAAKLVRFGLVERTRKITNNMLLLNPYSEKILTRQDGKPYRSLCAVDCSWENAERVLTHSQHFARGIQRRLPSMLAANPTNYSKLGKLTSMEALAGSLFILGYKNMALDLLNMFKWGPTFYKLNQDLLHDYLNANGPREIFKTEADYFGHLY